MSSSHTYLSALAITGSLLAGGPVLVGSTLASPGMQQEAIPQTIKTLSPTFNAYLLTNTDNLHGSGDHDRTQDQESRQENNSGAEDSQAPMILDTWVRPMEDEKEHGSR